MISYNISIEKWLQCILEDGTTVMLSLEDALIRSHQIREIFFSSPIEEISVLRFLQALFIIITKASDSQENWDNVNKTKKIDESLIRLYFERHRSKFDLFDSERPFYQHLDTLGMGKSPILLLFQDISSGNNNTLFDHNYNKKTQWIQLSRIVVGLITQQTFSIVAGNSRPVYFCFAPMASSTIFWIKGNNLFESLLLNTPFIPKNYKGLYSGLPSWDKNMITYDLDKQRRIESYVDYLTFQSRRIKIELPDDINVNNYNPESKEIFCSTDSNGFSLSICQGDSLEKTLIDPLTAQRVNSKTKEKFQYKLGETKDVWLDSEMLYTGFYVDAEEPLAPKNLTMLNYLINEKRINNQHYNVTVYTLNSDKAKLIKWRRSIMSFYPAIMKADGESNEKFDAMIKLLTKAEGISKLLYIVVLNYATILKNPNTYISDSFELGKNNILKDINPSDEELKLIKALADKLNPQSDYWKALEPIFYKSLESIAKKNDNENYDDIYKDFKSKSFNTALNAFDAAMYNAGSAKAYSIARNTFFNHKDKDEGK